MPIYSHHFILFKDSTTTFYFTQVITQFVPNVLKRHLIWIEFTICKFKYLNNTAHSYIVVKIKLHLSLQSNRFSSNHFSCLIINFVLIINQLTHTKYFDNELTKIHEISINFKMTGKHVIAHYVKTVPYIFYLFIFFFWYFVSLW